VTTREDVRQFSKSDLARFPDTHFNLFPWMACEEVRALEYLFLQLSEKIAQINVLSWGVTGDMLYFSDYLEELGKPWSWHVIDDHLPRVEAVFNRRDDCRTIDYRPEIKDYVKPELPDYLYEVVLVNGRWPNKCVDTAIKKLSVDRYSTLIYMDRDRQKNPTKNLPGEHFMNTDLWVIPR
jgi:hypothetical protein